MKPKNKKSVTVLIVDDDEKIQFAFEEVLKREGYTCLKVSNGLEGVALIERQRPAVVFMDITMPHMNGLEALERIKQLHPSLPIIMITGRGTMQTAIRAMQLGAFDYLTKPIDIEQVRSLIRRALETNRSISLRSPMRESIKAEFTDRYELVGNSLPMQEVYKTIGSVVSTPNHTNVLIVGESGTGKELVARTIHNNSSHASEPFIPINCTALPESLLESELFGHEKGSFTGAFELKRGKFEAAQSGSIFLDEIGSLSISLQQKLLRVLQEREFERVGGNDRLTVNARFIAATNVDLEAEVDRGTFRKDLFFRLNVVTIHIPPLRERLEDIPLLANYFLYKYAAQIKKPVFGFSDEALSMLGSLSYAGNVRQLENIIERAVIFTKGDVIFPDALPEHHYEEKLKTFKLPVVSSRFNKARDHVLLMFESQFIREQLSKHRGNVSEAAKESGMTRQNFQRLMQKHKIQAKKFR